ncbi:MAG: HAD family hydrolase [Candidatus Hodarchaeota archaeon]
MVSEEDRILFVFDLDGCLIDTFNYFKAYMGKVTKKFNIDVDDEVQDEIQDTILEMLGGKSSKILMFKIISYVSKKLKLGPIKRIKFFLHLKKIYRENISSVELIPGAVDTLKKLKELGHYIGIFTTTSSKEFNDRMENKKELLKYVDEIIVRDHVKHMKPDPEGILLLKEKLKIGNIKKVVMAGDMTHDIEAGINAGGISMGVLTGVNSGEDLKNAGALLVIDSIGDLIPNLPRIKELMDGNLPQ